VAGVGSGGPIGEPVRRREDPALLTGRGRYATDIPLPGLVHLAVVRSALPHGAIRRVDVAAAERLPGVLAVLTARDLPELDDPPLELRAPGPGHRARPVLARDRVRYVGEPVAVVVAEDPYLAADAADAVRPEIEPLPGAGDVLAATAPGAPLLHEGVEGNVAGVARRAFGDAAAAFSDADVVVAHRLRLRRVAGAYLEPRAVTAAWDGAAVTLWSSTQSVYGVRDRVAALLGLEPDRVRVLAEDVGGAFGAKGMPYAEEVLAPLLARRLDRPVRWVAGRSEDTSATAHSHGGVLDLELAATAAGELRGLRVRLLHDIGAHAGPGAEQGDNVLSHVVCAYRLPALDAEVRQVYTNAVPSGFIRGGGREVGNFAIERMLDLLARRLDLDPVEVRRRNLVPPDAMPHDTGYPRGAGATIVYDGGDYPLLLDTALAAIDHAGARRRQAAGARTGIGVACCVESTGIGVPEQARVHVAADGAVTAYAGSTPQGQGHRTSLAQVVAERLGWPLQRVRVVAGDTSAVPRSWNSAASRTAYEVGNAAALAGAAARRTLLDRAAELLEADPADLEVGPEGAAVRGAPARAVALAELLPDAGLEVTETFQSRRTYAGGCHAALVEVDPQTGGVDILRYVIAHDSGRSINPLLVDGQLHGGYAHGLGYALFEEAVYDEDGGFRSASFLDYTIASAPEIAVVPELHEVRGPVIGNPEGFRGVGESGTIPVPAAIASAVDDALRRHGADAFADELPLTPQRVYALARRATTNSRRNGSTVPNDRAG
jgi:aerobic carbon-monoxide dehydrogenase large subunit